VFFLFTPLQYVLVGLNHPMFELTIPVYASLFIPTRIALSGDAKRFLERSAKIQAGLLICVYSLSYAPALLHLQLKSGSNAGLLFYFVLMVQISDVAQYGWGQMFGKHVIAPEINASRTWEGFVGSVGTAAVVGILLKWVTPFGYWESSCMAMMIAVLGFSGRMVMSAIKRDRGVDDTGTLVQGHPGVLDRIDSICFAAPVFFHVTRAFFTVPA
jgi:phosphatidate cytidylyltransferase